MKEYTCKVCGFYNYPDKFWEKDMPMYIICPCCGCESGNEDYTQESTKEFRLQWIKNGAKWFNDKIKPENWNLHDQLKNVSETIR